MKCFLGLSGRQTPWWRSSCFWPIFQSQRRFMKNFPSVLCWGNIQHRLRRTTTSWSRLESRKLVHAVMLFLLDLTPFIYTQFMIRTTEHMVVCQYLYVVSDSTIWMKIKFNLWHKMINLNKRKHYLKQSWLYFFVSCEKRNIFAVVLDQNDVNHTVTMVFYIYSISTVHLFPKPKY